jgi:hypothetical protein
VWRGKGRLVGPRFARPGPGDCCDEPRLRSQQKRGPLGKGRPVLERLELRLGEGVVVRDARPRVRGHDAEGGQEARSRGRRRGHGGAAVGLDDERGPMCWLAQFSAISAQASVAVSWRSTSQQTGVAHCGLCFQGGSCLAPYSNFRGTDCLTPPGTEGSGPMSARHSA